MAVQNLHLTFTEQGGVGTNITLEAVDKDNGTNAEMNYSIISGNGDKYFGLTTSVGKWYIETIKALDREELIRRGSATLQVIVKAFNNVPVQNEVSSSTCTVVVTVLDINDNWPEFSNGAYSGQVLETAVNDTPIPLTPPVVVNDADFGDNGTAGVVFSLKSESSFFRINKTTGQLYVSLYGDHLDRETQDMYTMEIIATDQFGAGKSSSANVTITILDVNDEKPEFNQSSYSFTVSEKEQVDAVVGYVYAKDKDSGTTLYYLKGSSSFGILPLDGKIIVSGNLDSRVHKFYLLNVSACDVELLEGCSFVTITVNVTDTNDHCPVWNTSSLYMSVTETKKPQDVVGHLVAVDEDDDNNGLLTYFINDTAIKTFFNVTDNGDVRLLQVIEISQTFQFPVYARDGGNPACTQRANVEIKVDGVNKYDPVICYNAICAPAVVNLSVLDNAKAGSVIGYITSYDNDTGRNGQTHFYFPDNNFISITDGGFITLKKDVIKSEVFPDVIIWVVDSGFSPRNSSTVLHINIEPSLSVRPAFTRINYTFSVQENSAFYGDVRAYQSDGKSIFYSLVSGEDSIPFNIFSNGTIYNIKNLDRETEDRYEFIVAASVFNHTDLFTWALVSVLVTDVNDNPPVFEDIEITVSILENTNQTLTQLLATDADEGSNSTVTYYLADPANYPQFTLDAATGVLSVVVPLDREKQPSYTLTVVAKDGGLPSNSATATVHVLVADVNDNPPIFTQPSYLFNIKWSENISQTLYSVSATDADAGTNQKIVYTLEEVPNDARFFYIDPLSNTIVY
ncbi:Protocadherin Fat 4 [Bulinus truncatus]|nr:Protocadherin Fat 4 [Bulinus truncatus]